MGALARSLELFGSSFSDLEYLELLNEMSPPCSWLWCPPHPRTSWGRGIQHSPQRRPLRLCLTILLDLLNFKAHVQNAMKLFGGKHQAVNVRLFQISIDSLKNSYINFLPLLSIPRPNDPWCPDRVIPSQIPQKSFRSPQSGSARPPVRPFLRSPVFYLQALFSLILHFLANLVWRWSWLDSHKTEQEEMDRKSGTKAGVVRRET